MSTSKKVLDRINLTLECLREIDPIMPIQVAHVLTLIARHPGMTMGELMQKTGLSQASCSRNVAALSKHHRLGKSGYDLVEAIEDPADRRQKRLFLTPKGRERIVKLVGRGFPEVEMSEFDAPTAKQYEKAARAAGAR